MMKRESILIGMVAVLMVLNGCILFYFLTNGNGPAEHKPPQHRDKIIIVALQFDLDQQEQFDLLKTQHRIRIREINNQSNQLLERYFSLLHNDQDQGKDSIESQLASLEKQRVSVTYAHFADLKKVCRDDQKVKFDAFIPKLLEFVMPRGDKRVITPSRDRRN